MRSIAKRNRSLTVSGPAGTIDPFPQGSSFPRGDRHAGRAPPGRPGSATLQARPRAEKSPMRPALLRRFFRHGMLVQLLVFETVARLGSVTRAAAELHLAQPTVSMQLRKLAEALELTLFEQRGRGLALTPAGRALHESCADLIQSLARMEGRLAALRGPASEVLRAASRPSIRASDWIRSAQDSCS